MFLIPHLGTIIWTTIIFLVVYFLLSKFAWKPLIQGMDERESSIETALGDAAKARKKLEQLESDQKIIIEQSRTEKENLIKEGIEQRDKIITDAKSKTEVQVQKMINDARKRIEVEREAALVEMKDQIATLSIEIATKVVQVEMEDKKRHEKLVAQLIDDIKLN